MPDSQIWFCRISDETFVTYGLVRDMEQQFRQHELECDQAHEQDLADQFIEGLDICPDWPDYADQCWDVQHPQIFGP